MSRTHLSTCTLCEATCGIEVEVSGTRVTSIRGDEADPFSQGYVCPKATALADLYEDPDRLREPVKRTANGWKTIGWDEAFDEVARSLRAVQRTYGKDAIGVYQGNPTAHSLGLLTYGQVFLRGLGTRNRYSATSADQLPHMLSSLLMLGEQALFPIPDVDRTDYMLAMGANPLVSNGSVMTAPNIRRRLKDLQKRGGKLVAIDPRRSQTAELADEHVFIRPGTDALFLLALIHVVCDENLDDLGRLEAFADGADTIRAIARDYTPELVASATGIDAQDTRRIAREFANARTAVCYGRIGICTQEFGGLSSWLVNVLNAITGNFDSVGGAMFTKPAVDLVAMGARVNVKGSFDTYRSRVSGLPEFGGELPVSVLAEEIETPGDGQIRALITSAGNPALSIPNGARLERALEGLDFMVSIDPFINETTRHADIILPPTSPLERSHYDLAFYLVSVRNVAKYTPAVFERGAHQRHDWEIAVELATRMQLPESRIGSLVGRALRRVSKVVDPERLLDLGMRTGPYKLSMSKLRANAHGVDLGPLEPRLPDVLRTPNKRVDLAPSVYLGDLDRLRASVTAERDGLVLIGRRHLRSNNSWMHNSRRLVKGKVRCTLLMHPTDAEAAGLTDGESVEVSTRVGAVELPLEVTDEMMPGVISIPHGWGHDRPGIRLAVASEHAGVSLNDLTDERFFDALTANSGFSGVRVKVRSAAAVATTEATG
jgi:anaerobic selenocysteine-containing dehydrogenase